MILGNIVLQTIVTEYLYRCYGMSKKGIWFRISSILVLMCVWLCLISLDVIDSLLLSTLGIVLFYIAVVDSFKQMIPNSMLIQLLVIRCVLVPFQITHLLDHIIAGAMWLIFLCIVHHLTKQGIGAGDVKLIAVIGLYLGLTQVTLIVLLACLFIVLYSLLRVIMRHTCWKESLPMAPFLFVGYVMVIGHSMIMFGGI